MNKLGILLLANITLPGILQAELLLIDKIECVVCGPERNVPLVNTDEAKLDLNGQPVPLQQQIQNEIIAQQIVADKIPIDPEAAKKYVDMLKKQNSLTDQDLTAMFEQAGRTYQEGIELLGQQYMNELFLQHTFKSQQLALEEDIVKYFEQHPEYLPGHCQLQVAYADFNAQTKEALKKELDDLVAGKQDKVTGIEWSYPLNIDLSDIAQDKKALCDMKSGQIMLCENNGSFELYKLLEKQEPRLKTLDERRSAISESLGKQKMESLLSKYNQQVREHVGIINLSDQ